MLTAAPNYRRRLIDSRLAEVMAEFPAVLINGPRGVGKTTTARQFAADVVQLDDPSQAAAFRADPSAALANRREPLLLDEWQEVPEVLGAVRRAVDVDATPGRFILTGSVRAEMESSTWPGTGRLIRLVMYGLTESEFEGLPTGGRAPFLERLASGRPADFPLPSAPVRLPHYVERALRGGFPEVALRDRNARSRESWLDSYLEQLLARDILRVDPRRDVRKLRAYFEALAISTAGAPQAKTIMDAAGLRAGTARDYDRILSDLFITEEIPAWTSNRLSRLVHLPKRYVVDPAVAATAAGLTVATILGDGDQLGRTLDTFVMCQLRSEAALSGRRMRRHHLRTKEGRHEVDVVVELDGGRVLALECKATASPTAADAVHIAWLRDRLGDRFQAGAVMHTGPDVFSLGERILALPIRTLWG